MLLRSGILKERAGEIMSLSKQHCQNYFRWHKKRRAAGILSRLAFLRVIWAATELFDPMISRINQRLAETRQAIEEKK